MKRSVSFNDRLNKVPRGLNKNRSDKFNRYNDMIDKIILNDVNYILYLIIEENPSKSDRLYPLRLRKKRSPE